MTTVFGSVNANLHLSRLSAKNADGTGAKMPLTGGTLNGQLVVSDTTDSVSTVTGSIHTDGGLGVVKSLTVGIGINMANTLSGTSVASAITQNTNSGKITTENLTTAAAATYTLTVTNNKVLTTSNIVSDLDTSQIGAGTPLNRGITPGNGSFTLKVTNIHAANAFDTKPIVLSYLVLN